MSSMSFVSSVSFVSFVPSVSSVSSIISVLPTAHYPSGRQKSKNLADPQSQSMLCQFLGLNVKSVGLQSYLSVKGTREAVVPSSCLWVSPFGYTLLYCILNVAPRAKYKLPLNAFDMRHTEKSCEQDNDKYKTMCYDRPWLSASARKHICEHGTFNWWASSYPDFDQNYFLLIKAYVWLFW